jgi:4-amino-4-deoxy-L-arabinose transferase-like glycosyltransferase
MLTSGSHAPRIGLFPRRINYVWILFSAALVVRIAYFAFLAHSEPPRASDHFLYGGETGSIAASIASGHGFSSPLSAPSGPTAWMTPVFPFLLAGIFKLFGIFTIHSNHAVKFLDILFSSLTIFPLAAIARRLFGQTTAKVASWIWVFLPSAVYLPVVWVWDMSLAALVLTTAIWLSIPDSNPPAKQQTGWYFAIVGFVWGFAVLVNAAILSLFPPILAITLYSRNKNNLPWLRPAMLASLAFALTLAPWIIRNEIVFHGKVSLRSNFGLELWLGNNPEVPDTWTWWLHPTGSRQEYEKFFRMGEVAYMQEKRQLALDFIKSHPAQTARFQFHRFLETWTGNSDSFLDIWRTGSFALRTEVLYQYSLTLLMLLGMFFAYRRLAAQSLSLLCAIAIFPIPYYLCHTTSRYRHPIDPIIAILAAYGTMAALEFFLKKYGRTTRVETPLRAAAH